MLIAAERAFDQLDAWLYSAVTRWRRGELMRDDAGRELVATAKEQMHQRLISNPQGLVCCLAPGFRGLR